MAINLNRFVDISISHITSSSTYQRDTALLVLFNQAEDSFNVINSTDNLNVSSEEYKFAFNFFNNGGVKLAIKKTKSVYADADFKDILKSLNYEYIIVMSNISNTQMVSFASTYNASEDVSQLYKKFFLTSVKENNNQIPELASDDFYTVVKYGEVGCEASIAAYLTKIDLDENNSVNDYMFTEEDVKNITYTASGQTTTVDYKKFIVEDDGKLELLSGYKYNVNVILRNSTRVIGGNTLKGYDLVNEYMLLVLQQTLTEKLVDLLDTKIKYNSLGLTKINGVMIRELNRYVNNGFLMPNKTYDGSEDIMDITGTVVLLTKGAKLVSGYKYYIAPFSSLTEKEKEDHLLPAITLILSDGYSIRKITVDGYLY